MILTDVLEIQLGSPWDSLAVEFLQYQSDGFGGRIWVVTRIHRENLNDDIILACDDGYAIRKCAAAVCERRMLGDPLVPAMQLTKAPAYLWISVLVSQPWGQPS